LFILLRQNESLHIYFRWMQPAHLGLSHSLPARMVASTSALGGMQPATRVFWNGWVSEMEPCRWLTHQRQSNGMMSEEWYTAVGCLTSNSASPWVWHSERCRLPVGWTATDSAPTSVGLRLSVQRTNRAERTWPDVKPTRQEEKRNPSSGWTAIDSAPTTVGLRMSALRTSRNGKRSTCHLGG